MTEENNEIDRATVDADERDALAFARELFSHPAQADAPRSPLAGGTPGNYVANEGDSRHSAPADLADRNFIGDLFGIDDNSRGLNADPA